MMVEEYEYRPRHPSGPVEGYSVAPGKVRGSGGSQTWLVESRLPSAQFSDSSCMVLGDKANFRWQLQARVYRLEV